MIVNRIRLRRAGDNSEFLFFLALAIMIYQLLLVIRKVAMLLHRNLSIQH